LFVPSEVGLILNANRVHRMGTSGKGVKIAMVDTGFYRHPFYSWNGFRVKSTVLGPGATDPTKDNYSHGTGEAANIFSTAPDIELTPIKMASDTVGAFNKAVDQKPHVITNSWGYSVDVPGATLSPYLKTLETAVANAVAKGIVVCFSAGNGHFGFPGSHPDVISVGGVHVNSPFVSYNDLEASTYASSFDSSLYPGRHVPDICGLVGKKVSGTAPLIMLPVQPGSTLDFPNTGSTSDGWGIFSGTSAASPQVAGVVALMLEKDPTLTPTRVKKLLKETATDIKTGQSSMGDSAGPGPDDATGSGLVNAKWAYIKTMGSVAVQFFEASPELQAKMLEKGQMPELSSEFVDDLLETLRSSRT
jgi:subtilisin family serine protease